jgi:hypothetical protein
VVADALHTAVGVNHVDVAFADRVRRAFWYASATGNAVVLDFHGHRFYLLNEIDITLLILISAQAVK